MVSHLFVFVENTKFIFTNSFYIIDEILQLEDDAEKNGMKLKIFL